MASPAAGARAPERRYSIPGDDRPPCLRGWARRRRVPRALALTGTIVAVGAVAFRRLVAPRAGIIAAAEAPLARLGATGATGAMLVAGGAPFRIWTQASAFALEPAETWSYVPRVLGTAWGIGATVQAVAALGVAFGPRRVVRLAGGAKDTSVPESPVRDAPGRALVALGTLGLIATPAMMGHAIVDERSVGLARARRGALPLGRAGGGQGRAVWRTRLAEVVVAAGIVLVTAVLTGTEPANAG